MAALPALVGAGAAFPFEHVAKATLIIAAAAFVANPFPSARLYSVATVVIVQAAGTGEPPASLLFVCGGALSRGARVCRRQ